MLSRAIGRACSNEDDEARDETEGRKKESLWWLPLSSLRRSSGRRSVSRHVRRARSETTKRDDGLLRRAFLFSGASSHQRPPPQHTVLSAVLLVGLVVAVRESFENGGDGE